VQVIAMSMNEMLQRIDSLYKKEVGTGATAQEIADAERAIGVRLPASYRAFLSRFGWARVYFDPLYGVGPSVPSHYALVTNVLSERYEAQPLIPRHLVPIMNDGAGNNYCLDTSRFHDDECPVVFWDHEHEDGPDQTPEEVSPSFDRWLIDRITNGLHSDNA
jgi:cell wall assembly regulator SMI1